MSSNETRSGLRVYGRHGLAFGEALAAFAKTLPPSGAVGIVLAPSRFALIRVDAGGGAADPEGPCSIDDVYEARVFHPHAELRWLRDPRQDGRGSAVAICDGAATVELPPQELSIPVVGTLEQTYVLWGLPAKQRRGGAGWTRLTTARIGGIDVPTGEVPDEHGVAVRAIEYLGQLADGNVAVVEERLCNLTTFKNR